MIKTIAAIAAGILAVIFLLRIAGYFAFSKLVRAEQQHILTSDQYKIKGRYE